MGKNKKNQAKKTEAPKAEEPKPVEEKKAEEPKPVEKKPEAPKPMEKKPEAPKAEEPKPAEEEKEEITEDQVGAFDIKAASDKGVDYDKLIDKYGCFKIQEEMLKKIEELTGDKAHTFLRRNIFFCQRDLQVILNSYEAKKPFYLYTGRGPSSDALHMGHCVPMIFCQYLQKAFDVPIVIQITDDEKFIYRPELELDGKKGTIEMGIANIKDIIAFGFDPEKTFIFLNTKYIGQMYSNVIKVQKHVNYNQIKGIFGFNESDNVGKFAFPPVQAVPAFSNTFEHIFGKRTNVPCLIPAAIDQDPYFRMTRDVAQKLKYQKPASIYSTFFPALQGLKSKMSSSDPNSAIFVTDTPDQIKKKINKYAFSGGQQLAEDQRRLGANLEVDVPYQWLTFFLEDDEELEDIRVKYSKGDLLTGEVKARLIKCLQDWVKAFQERRKKVTNKDVEHFMSIRKINAVPARWGDISGGAAAQGDKKGATATAGSVNAPGRHLATSIQEALNIQIL